MMKQVLEQLKADMSSDKVVFLDIDGVIGDTWQIRDATRRGVFQNGVRSFTRGDKVYWPQKEILFRIFDHYDVVIIVVSSWLSSYQTKESQEVRDLNTFFETQRIIGSLSTHGNRAESIREFVEYVNPRKWVVVDDAYPQMYQSNPFFATMDNFVRPEGRWGVSMKDLERLSLILSDEPLPWERECHGLPRLDECKKSQ